MWQRKIVVRLCADVRAHDFAVRKARFLANQEAQVAYFVGIVPCESDDSRPTGKPFDFIKAFKCKAKPEHWSRDLKSQDETCERPKSTLKAISLLEPMKEVRNG